MNLDEQDLKTIFEDVWCGIMERVETPHVYVDTLDANDLAFTARVDIDGDAGREGCVSIECGEDVARRISARMFDHSPTEITSDDMLDAVGEFANQLGGCVKTTLAFGGCLSPPHCSVGPEALGGWVDEAVLSELSAEADGHPVRIRVRALVVNQPLPAGPFDTDDFVETPIGTEGREFTRVTTNIEASIQVPEGFEIDGNVSDVSVGGLFVNAPVVGLAIGDKSRVTLFLGGREGGLHVGFAATVARITEEGAAFELEDMTEEAFAHLQRLVLWNSQDPDRVEDEIERNLGIRRLAG